MVDLSRLNAAPVNPTFGSEGRTAVPRADIAGGIANLASAGITMFKDRQAAEQSRRDATALGSIVTVPTAALEDTPEDNAVIQGLQKNIDRAKAAKEAGEASKSDRIERLVGQQVAQVIRDYPHLTEKAVALWKPVTAGLQAEFINDRAEADATAQRERQREQDKAIVDLAIKANPYIQLMQDPAEQLAYSRRYLATDVLPEQVRIKQETDLMESLTRQAAAGDASAKIKAQELFNREIPTLMTRVRTNIHNIAYGSGTTAQKQAKVRAEISALQGDFDSRIHDPALHALASQQLKTLAETYQPVVDGVEKSERLAQELANNTMEAELRLRIEQPEVATLLALKDFGDTLFRLVPSTQKTFIDIVADADARLKGKTTSDPLVEQSASRLNNNTVPLPPQIQQAKLEDTVRLIRISRTGEQTESKRDTAAYAALRMLESETLQKSNPGGLATIITELAQPGMDTFLDESRYQTELQTQLRSLGIDTARKTSQGLQKQYGKDITELFDLNMTEQGRVTLTPKSIGDARQQGTLQKQGEAFGRALTAYARAYAHAQGSTDYEAALRAMQ